MVWEWKGDGRRNDHQQSNGMAAEGEEKLDSKFQVPRAVCGFLGLDAHRETLPAFLGAVGRGIFSDGVFQFG